MTTGYGLIASADNFANANNNGEADYNNASNVNGVRPLLRALNKAISRSAQQGMSLYPSHRVNKCRDA